MDLPSSPTDVLPPSQAEPVVVTVDNLGDVYLDLGIRRKIK